MAGKILWGLPLANIWRKLSPPDYQFILHPGYNKDRGPARSFAEVACGNIGVTLLHGFNCLYYRGISVLCDQLTTYPFSNKRSSLCPYSVEYYTPPLTGILLLALYIIATFYYPGGSQFDKQSAGFSWSQKVLVQPAAKRLCDCGQINYAKPIARWLW